MATLDIGNTMIDTTFSRIIQPDKRGKHRNQKTLDPVLCEAIRDHINFKARVESHYLNKFSREYFERILNVSTLSRWYFEKCIK